MVALFADRLESPSRKLELVLGCAAFGGCACRMAILLGRVSEERITQSEVQRLERSRFHDRSTLNRFNDPLRCDALRCSGFVAAIDAEGELGPKTARLRTVGRVVASCFAERAWAVTNRSRCFRWCDSFSLRS